MQLRLVCSQVEARLVGTQDYLSEVVEQLAWLGSSLRLPNVHHQLTLCRPVLEVIHKPGESHSSGEKSYVSANRSFRLRFDLSPIAQPAKNVNSCCWHGMFDELVIACGLPIPARTTNQGGLEAHIAIAAALVCTKRLTKFDERHYMMGFSRVLALTAIHEGVVVWHFLSSGPYDKRLRYTDKRSGNPKDAPATEELQSLASRQIIG